MYTNVYKAISFVGCATQPLSPILSNSENAFFAIFLAALTSALITRKHFLQTNNPRCFRLLREREAQLEQVSISERSLHDIEKGKMSINIILLDEILKLNNQQLMPFLAKENSCIYHIRSSEHVKLPTHPSTTLSSLLKSLLFHKKIVRIPENNTELVHNLEEYFQITIQDNKISNKLLLRFFSIFCETKFHENQ